MEGYRVLIGNLTDSTWYEEIPVTRINFSQVLNGPGKCDISTSPNPVTDSWRNKISTDYLKPGRSTIYIEKDGVIVGAYILWELFVIYPANRIRLIGEGLWSYFRKRVIETTVEFSGTDQFLIAKNLIDTALNKTGGNIVNMSTTGTSTSSGITLDRSYYGYQRRFVGEAIEDLADRENGFDFEIDTEWVPNSSPPTISNTYRQYYPKKGTTALVVFDLDANLTRLQWQQKAQKFVNKLYMVGAGSADDTTLVTATDVGSLTKGYPLLEHKLVKKDVADSGLLSQYAVRELNQRNQLYEILTLELDPKSVETRLGSFKIGDIARVKASRGWVSLDKLYRIMSYDVWVNEGANDERISLNMAIVEATL